MTRYDRFEGLKVLAETLPARSTEVLRSINAANLAKRLAATVQPDLGHPPHMLVFEGPNMEGTGRIEPTKYHAAYFVNDRCDMFDCPLYRGESII